MKYKALQQFCDHLRAEGFPRSDIDELTNIVEAIVDAEVAAERNLCASVASEYDGEGHEHGPFFQLGDSRVTQEDIKNLILARGEQHGVVTNKAD